MSTTIQEITSENTALRAQLEKDSPGCTAVVPACKSTATLDEILGEQDVLRRVAAAVGASTNVQQRGARVAAAYRSPSGHIRTEADTKRANLQAEIAKRKLALHGATGTTRTIHESKLATAEKALAGLGS